MTTTGQYLAPYDGLGNMLHYPLAGYKTSVVWRENKPFEAQLELDSMRSGRSAKYVIWLDRKTGVQYPMFITDLLDLLKRSAVDTGVTYRETWIVRKRGQNYGLALAKEV